MVEQSYRKRDREGGPGRLAFEKGREIYRMPQPPLYKYLDLQGAKLTLGNRTFKHSKPSDFNDTEDLNSEHFPGGP